MTRDDIAINIAHNLNDLGLNYFSSEDINNSIQDGYDEVSAYCMQIEKNERISLQANLVYYDLQSLISDYHVVSHVYNETNKMWLHPSSSKTLDEIRWDWELWTGEPRYFFPHSFNLLCIAPHKIVTTGTLQIFYRGRADKLVGNSTPQLHTDAVNLLEYYSTYDLLAAAKEYVKSIEWYGKYKQMLVKYRDDQKQLAWADRIGGLE